LIGKTPDRVFDKTRSLLVDNPGGINVKKTMLLAAALFALAACGGDGGAPQEPGPTIAAAPTMADIAETRMDRAREEFVRPDSSPDLSEPAEGQFIAYSHSLGLAVPKGQVEGLLQAHVALCQAAGAATCIVVSSNVYSQEEDYASGDLSIRATPDWITRFMETVSRDLEKAGGEIIQRSTRAEDLTRQIIDTGARLDAQRTLQKRLLDLLEGRDGDLGDLLQIEREYARVTGDIESIEAQLKTLRLRVAMSSLDINYQTRVAPFSASRENPLGRAFGDFFYNFSTAVASVITAFAVGLPWIALISIFLWIWLKLIWPRLRGRKKTDRT
jgi:hypothetical protein